MEEKERALKEFGRLGSVQVVITLLDYPSRHTLYDRYRNKIANTPVYHVSPTKPYLVKQKYLNHADHPSYTGANLKLEAIKRCFFLGGCVEYVSREIRYSRMSIYTWYRKYKKYEVAGLMSSKKQIKIENIDFNTATSKQPEKYSEVRERITKLFNENRRCYGYKRIFIKN